MLAKTEARKIVFTYGADILMSSGMQLEKTFFQHGTVSVYEHSLSVAVLCVVIAAVLPVRINTRALVRGALLHDYFLYDWHISDKSHRLHGFHHAKRAYQNASRDFLLSEIEENMICSHMFPLNLVLPKCRESMILCLSDKLCASKEVLAGFFSSSKPSS